MKRTALWTVSLMLVSLPVVAADQEIPPEVVERYLECSERHDLDAIRDLLWVHNNVERIDASIYGLPEDDFDDPSLLTIQERLDFRAERARLGIEMPAPGMLQYPHFLRKALDAHYERTGERPSCLQILIDAGVDLSDEPPEVIAPGWPSDLNITATDGAGADDPHSRGEVNIAINPLDQGHLIATSVPSGSGEDASYLAVSTDHGATWHKGAVAKNGGYAWECDPVTFYQTSTGVAYHAKLGCTTQTCTATHSVARRSTDGGITWTDCESRPGFSNTEDREWLVIDNSPGSACYGDIWAMWHSAGLPWIARSTDGCQSWGDRQHLGAGGLSMLQPDLAVAGDGHVYAIWDSNNTPHTVNFAGSADCGVTYASPGPMVLKDRNGNAQNRIPAQCGRHVGVFPTVDVDRSPGSDFYGRVYVAIFDFNQVCRTQGNWTCATWDTNWNDSCNFDIWFSYSDTNGASWVPFANLSAADGNNVDQFMGFLRVDPADGSVFISFHGTRLNPTSAVDRQRTHYYVMRSIDGGQSWEEPLQVSTIEGDQRSAGADNLFDRGDYQGLDVRNGVVWPLWIDRRGLTGAGSEEEIVIRKICSEPTHWSERSPTFSPPTIEVFEGGGSVTVVWEPPDLFWGDGGENPDDRSYELWVDGLVGQSGIPWTDTSTTYSPGDTATHSYVVRAVNQCGFFKDYASADAAVCPTNPDSVDVTPDGPLTLCTGTGQLLTAGSSEGLSLDFQWYRDGAPVGGNTATYTANDTGTHDYHCVVSDTGCAGGVPELQPTTITWQQQPLFGGLQSAASTGGGACGIELAWNAATAVCAGPVVYNIYRSETSGFSPGAGNLIAGGVSGTGYNDVDGVEAGVAYYYVVRAEDSSNGVEEANLVELSAETSGAGYTLLANDFEGSLQGWTPSLGSPPATTGGFVFGDPVGTVGNYGPPCQPEDDTTPGGSECLYSAENPDPTQPGLDDIDGGEVIATSPAFVASGFDKARLSFWRWFFNEDNDDVGDYFILEVSNDGGSSWIVVDEVPGEITNTNLWTELEYDLEDFVELSDEMQIRVRGADGPTTGDLVEVAIDDVEIVGFTGCLPASEYIFADYFETGDTSNWSATVP